MACKSFFQIGKTEGKVLVYHENTDIANESQYLIAFPSRTSNGTQDTVRKFGNLDRPMRVHWVEEIQ